MQCGSFKGATQKGLKIGTIRDVLPHIQGGELPKKEGEFNLTESILPKQCGSYGGATQKGKKSVYLHFDPLIASSWNSILYSSQGIKISTIRDVVPHVSKFS